MTPDEQYRATEQLVDGAADAMHTAANWLWELNRQIDDGKALRLSYRQMNKLTRAYRRVTRAIQALRETNRGQWLPGQGKEQEVDNIRGD